MQIKRWHQLHAALVFLGFSLIYAFTNLSNAFYWAFGAMVAQVNVLILSYTWKRVIEKKSVALAFLGIVSKYAILMILLENWASHDMTALLWVSMGFGLFILTSVIQSLMPNQFSGEEVNSGK